MDIVAHALWAGAGTLLAARRVIVPKRTAALIVGFAVLPDVLQFVPIAAWALAGDGSWAALARYAVAQPGGEPLLPAAVTLLSHYLHCMLHSAVIAAAVTALAWLATRALWWPLLGWWSHIVIDVWTHSADFYPVPVLYPFSDRGFDGLAWNEPWFLLLNYSVLGLFFAWVAAGRGAKRR